MKIGFGVTVLAKGRLSSSIDGIGTYTRELGSCLGAGDAVELHPVSFGTPFPGEAMPAAAPCLTLPPYPLLAGASACLPLPFRGTAALKRGIDLFHATDHLVPRLAGIPVLATVMDAIPLAHPQWVRSRWRVPKAWLWRQAVRWADHVVTISEYSRQEIAERFCIAPERISVVPLGVEDRYFAPVASETKQQILSRLGLPRQFFLFVGTLQPRKNIDRILAAHACLPPAMQREVPLVVVGRAGWGCDELLARLSQAEFQGRARWLRYLPDDEVMALLQSATALVFTSLHEGFGLPVLEAFASGLPVITSTTTALPEAADGAALLADPTDTDAIAAAMQALVENPELAQSLRRKGLRRARELTWLQCAARTREIYRRILDKV